MSILRCFRCCCPRSPRLSLSLRRRSQHQSSLPVPSTAASRSLVTFALFQDPSLILHGTRPLLGAQKYYSTALRSASYRTPDAPRPLAIRSLQPLHISSYCNISFTALS